MQLEEFFNYKNEMMKQICSNANIAKLILNDDTAPSPAHTLPYKYVFPLEYVPDTVDNAATFVCFDIDVTEVPNKTFLYPVIYVWIFTHKSLLVLPDHKGLRLDNLAIEINKTLNGNRFFGMGTLDLKKVQRFVPITDYQGRSLTYTTVEWNRPGVNKSIPKNRFDGV